MVKDYNETLYPEGSIEFVNEFFKNNLTNYMLVKTNFHAGYWWIEYKCKNDDLTIVFDGDIGGHFTIYIYIAESKYSLWQYDRSVSNASKSNKKDILYQLKILKQFIQGIS